MFLGISMRFYKSISAKGCKVHFTFLSFRETFEVKDLIAKHLYDSTA